MSEKLRAMDGDLVRGRDLVESVAEDLGVTFDEALEALAPVATALLGLPGEEHYEALRAIENNDLSEGDWDEE